MAMLARPINAIINSVALPASLLVVGAVLLGAQLDLPMPKPAPVIAGPETLTLAPADFSYRADGYFLRNGSPVDAPMLEARLEASLVIMKYQVSAADYAQCVQDRGCVAAEPQNPSRGNVPVTGVNFDDAIAYADWLSQRTGQHWTLPTDREWAFAAGSDFAEEALAQADNTNPALRWIANYQK